MHSNNEITIKLPPLQMEIVKRAAAFSKVSPEQLVIQQLNLGEFEDNINNAIRSAAPGHLGTVVMDTCSRCVRTRPIGGGADECGECVFDFPPPCPKEVHDAFQNTWCREYDEGTHCANCNQWLPPRSNALLALREPTFLKVVDNLTNALTHIHPDEWADSYFSIAFRNDDAYGAVWMFTWGPLEQGNYDLSQSIKMGLSDSQKRIEAVRGREICEFASCFRKFIELCRQHDAQSSPQKSEDVHFYKTWGPMALSTIATQMVAQVQRHSSVPPGSV